MVLLANIEFANQNGIRAFPISSDATGLDVTGSFKLPTSFILGLRLPVHAGLDVDPGSFFVLQIGSYATGYSVVIGYQPSIGSPIVVASAQIPRVAHVPGNTYNLGGINDFADSSGRITIGELNDIDNQPPGLWTFNTAGTLLEPDAIAPIIRGISSISIANGSDTLGPFYGDILLRAGANERIDYDEFEGKPRLTFNAINGAGLQDECACDTSTASPILTIDGVGPDASGNLNLLTDECVTVTPVANGLLLTDKCSQPCCDCVDAVSVTQALESLQAQVPSLNNFLTQMETAVTQMNLVVLGSRLGDRSCVPSE